MNLTRPLRLPDTPSLSSACMALALLFAACAAPLRLPGGDPGEELLVLAPVKQLHWEGRNDAARATLDVLGWEHTGNLAAERMRQDLRLAAGQRAGKIVPGGSQSAAAQTKAGDIATVA